ncbi:adenylate/guanylate cyclase domain-containing protein [Spartinivicinus ruber]|uniref:adenylate/guanylate cyclase domain-containing protein n=1 Tax=Spartinivicinus ruber TaxID=2683272 RepID=UPI0013D8C31F|nr:adenylate/guanylate cyclase domain-containing protein [Spartinivicinus ruber]
MRKPSISSILSIGFGLLLVIAVGLVLYLGISSTRKNTLALLEELATVSLFAIKEQVSEYLNPINEQLDYAATILESGQLQVDDSPEFNKMMNGTLAAVPQSVGIAYVDDLYFSRFYNRKKQQLVTDYWLSYQPIQEALNSTTLNSQNQWLAPIYSHELKQSIIPVLRTVLLPDKTRGVLIAGISLTKLNQLTTTISRQFETPIFILDQQQQAIAVAQPSQPIQLHFQPQQPIPKLNTLRQSPLSVFWQNTQHQPYLIEKEKFREHRVYWKDNHYYFIFQELRGFSDKPWLVGIYLAHEQVFEPIMTIVKLLVIGIVLLIIFVLLASWFGNRIGKDFKRIASGFDNIANMAVSDLEKLPHHPIAEFDSVATAYNQMIDKLKAHEQVRRLFGQYVPTDIAKKILAANGQVTPELHTATIFYSDIVGFTSMAEQLSPCKLVAVLNQYFALTAKVLDKYRGMITQFQGDAILAIFNIPNPQPNHANQAVHASLMIQSQLNQQFFDGVSIQCRIGINTGEVIAGSVGTREQLNYTVHGDSVNLAARLESLNKEYGTAILVAETTVKQCTQITFKEIGDIPIRGKHNTVRVFTPLPEVIESQDPDTAISQ